jgi:hypothetical protein
MPEEKLSLDDFDLDISSTEFELKSTSKPSKQEVIPSSLDEEKNFVRNVLNRLEKNIDRVRTIFANLRYSRIFEVRGNSEREFLDNLERDLEEFATKELEKIQLFYEDFRFMPRSISSYANRYTPLQKEKLRLKATEIEKYQLIFEWEMQEKLFDYLKDFGKLMIELMRLLNQKNSSGDLKVLGYHSQKMFEDAKTASLFVMGEIDNIRREIEKWKMVVSNA